MKRGAALALVLSLTGACRRHHQAPPSEETAAAPAPPPAGPTLPTPAEPTSPPPLAAPSPQPRMPDGGTINGDPRGPRAAEFNRVVAAAQPRLGDCLERAELPTGEWTVIVHYFVEPPGYTGAVTTRGNAPRPVQDCVRAVVEGLRFSEFRGPKVEQDLPVTLRRVDKAARSEGADAGAKP